MSDADDGRQTRARRFSAATNARDFERRGGKLAMIDVEIHGDHC